MNNYCRNCGKKLNGEINVCSNCGAEIFEQRVIPDSKKKELILQKEKEKKYIITMILLYAVPYLIGLILKIFLLLNIEYDNLTPILSIIIPLFRLSALITLIYARITMPGSKVFRILLTIIIIIISLNLVAFLALMVTCMTAFNGW